MPKIAYFTPILFVWVTNKLDIIFCLYILSCCPTQKKSKNIFINWNIFLNVNNFTIYEIIIILYLAELQTICREYWNKIARLEGDKYDLEVIEQFKKFEVIGQPARVIFLYTFNIRFFLFVYYFSYKLLHKTVSNLF